MAAKVVRQNAGGPACCPLAPGSIAMQAARALIVTGEAQPYGSTDSVLHRLRHAAKWRDGS